MSKKTVQFRRKREAKTNYKKRLSYVKSGKLRLVVRKSNKNILAQLIEYSDDGDKVVVNVKSTELKKYGWTLNTGNLPSAYLVGYLLGSKAKGKEAILDLGLQSPVHGSRVFAVVKGAMDAGLKMNVAEEVLPKEERLNGSHIVNHLKESKDKIQYSLYKKSKIEPDKIKDLFEKTKQKLMK